MKRFFVTAISILFFACVVVGVYLAIQYSTSKSNMALIFLGVSLFGFIGLVIEIIIAIKLNGRKKD